MDFFSQDLSWLEQPAKQWLQNFKTRLFVWRNCALMWMCIINIYTYIYKLTVERQRPLFCNKALTKQLKEYETQLISLYMYSNSAITETE